MCLNLYEYQLKASKCSNGLTYLKNRIITNQQHKTDSQKKKKQKNKRRECKRSIKENKTIKGKTKRKEQRRNTKSMGKKKRFKWQ